MLQLIKHEKDVGGEDQKTLSVIENLLLLPDTIMWEIMCKAMISNVDQEIPMNVGILNEFYFWPHWYAEGTRNKIYVEPDVFLRFENYDVIIEAKKYDECGQYFEQWKKEIMAYLNEYKWDKKKVLFIALGGNDDLAERRIKLLGVSVPIYKCNWLSIQYAVAEYRKALFSRRLVGCDYNSVKKILDQVLLAFELNGMPMIS